LPFRLLPSSGTPGRLDAAFVTCPQPCCPHFPYIEIKLPGETQTHSRQTQSHADPSRARQVWPGPSDPRTKDEAFRTRPRPDDRDLPTCRARQASMCVRARPTTNQSSSQPLTARTPSARSESWPNPNPTQPQPVSSMCSVCPQGALNPNSGLPRDLARGGAPYQ
jgi:hypothetical protein